MNKQLLIISSIIITGTLFGIGYATSTVISDAGITTPAVTTTTLSVSGTCTGCGASEGNYVNYNTVQFNNTLGLGSGDVNIQNMLINNNGTINSIGSTWQLVVKDDGTVVYKQSDSINPTTPINPMAQSMTGKYQININLNGGSPIFKIFKDSTFLQNLGINNSQFNGGGTYTLAISPNGKYIAFLGKDVGGADDRLVIFRGS